MLKMRSFIPLGLRFWLYLGAFLLGLALFSLQLHYRQNLSPYNLNALAENEVLFFRHGFGEASLSMKLHTLKIRKGADVLIVGNHMARSVYDDRPDTRLDLFNLVYGNTGLQGTLDLLHRLKDEDLLPRKALVVTLLTHGDLAREIDTKFRFASENLPRYIWDLLGQLPELVRMEYLLPGLSSLSQRDLLFDYDRCSAIFEGKISIEPMPMQKFRRLVASFVPVYALIKLGIMPKDEACAIPELFRDVDFESYNRYGGFMARYTPKESPSFHTPYDLPHHSDAMLKTLVAQAAKKIGDLDNFAKEHDFRILYLYPPRYEKPLDGYLDIVANKVFEKLPSAPVADFRRLSLDRTLYYDDTHVGAKFRRILLPCIEKFLTIDPVPTGSPALKGRGRTIC